ncbi:MAG: transcriptional repressor [Clostridia bacterium]|nr:transcriptional repressor [Clostridia bacterium]
MAEYQTQQKTLLLDYMARHAESSLSMEEVAEGLKTDLGDKAPGKSTVYRLVNRLVEEGTVRRFNAEDSRRALYQIVGGKNCNHHLHMKCTQCGRLMHMNDEQSEKIIKQIYGNSSFAVSQEQTTLYGSCAECSNQNKK